MQQRVAVVILSALLLVACDSDGGDAGGNNYQAEYGGSASVYARIAGLSDCAALQEEFDTAADNNDRAEPGTPQHRQTLGYMTAALDRMEAVGCDS